MKPDAVALLRCPHCGAGLTLVERTLRCPEGHAFDLARQGYVSLLPGNAHTGTADTSEMVAARAAFLERGHYAPLREAVGDAAVSALAVAADAPAARRAVVELGAGTGWYLAHVLDRLPGRDGLALDVSKPALRRAARSHPRIAAVACDAWQPLPLRDGVAELALSVFAPRNAAELARVLVPGGVLVVVTPEPDHLAELRPLLGLLDVDPRKPERLAAQLGERFETDAATAVERTLALDRGAVTELVAMGPSALHGDAEARATRIAALPEPLAVSLRATVTTYRAPARAPHR